MKKRYKILTSMLFMTIVIGVCTNNILGLYASLLVSVNFVSVCFLGTIIEYKIHKKSNPDIKLLINKLWIPVIHYKNRVVLRKLADMDILMPKIVFTPMSIFVISVLNVMKIENTDSLYRYVILGVVAGLLFQYKDVEKLLKIWLGNSNAFYVNFIKDKVELVRDDSVMSSHKNVYFYEEAFKSYKLVDLKRELIINEQNIVDSQKKGFWDSYMVPLIFIMTTSMISFYNGIWISYSNQSEDFESIIRYQFLTMLIIVTLMIQIFLFKRMFHTPKKDLVIINLVLKDLISLKNE